ncbi:MAG: hypothetical protein JOY84_10120 [Curvibacter sp.]|nr:hypothetical protein [Curvibacter sp.]
MKKKLVLATVGVAMVGFVTWGFIAGRQERSEEQDRARPVEVPSRVVALPEGMAVIFDAETQERADIAISSVQMATRRGEVEALAAVLSAQDLIDLRSAYVAASTQVDRAQAAAHTSRREFERIRTLHGDEFNVSTKTLEAAQAQWQADEAAARGALEALAAQEQSASQRWGGVLAAAVAGNTPGFRRLVEGQDVLLRVAAPSGSALARAPSNIRVAANDVSFRLATLVSPSPVADPRIQGPTFFYIAPVAGFLPGTTLTAYLPTGQARGGGVIPADAVVWWQGKAWYYMQSAPDRFLRRELEDAQQVDEGWFVVGLSAQKIVVRGAQTLLSEELRSQIQVGEENK